MSKSNDVGGIAADRLKSFVERIERLEEEKKGIQEDIKEVYAESKGTGFDPKIIRQIIRLRKMDKADREEQQAILALYGEALGMDLGPLFEDRAAVPPAPTPLESVIDAKRTEAGRFDPVRAMAEGIASGDERITKAATFPPGTTIEITPSSSRTDWPDGLPKRFVSDGSTLRPEDTP